MLFLLTWTFTDTSEEGGRRSLEVFAAWTPPAGAIFKEFHGYADGSGGVAIVEVDTIATLGRSMAPFTPWLEFTATPLIPIEESAAIASEAIAFRDHIS